MTAARGCFCCGNDWGRRPPAPPSLPRTPEQIATEIEGMLIIDSEDNAEACGWNTAIRQAALIAREPGWADL